MKEQLEGKKISWKKKAKSKKMKEENRSKLQYVSK
jgi:hypothetical protein